jgi:hypothetical protein
MQDRDAIQRLLNEAKKAELTERFGAVFPPCAPGFPPQIESAWLKHVEEFELRCRAAGRTTVRRYIGDPPVCPLGMLPPESLGEELDRLLGILENNSVRVDFSRPLSEAEKYRFLTEELLEREIEDIRMDGLVLNFLYEEFHPDDAREAMMTGEDFFFAFFQRDSAMLSNVAGLHRLPAGTPEAFLSHLRKARALLPSSPEWNARVLSCALEEDQATLSAFVRWSGKRDGADERVARSGRAILRLQKADAYWYVTDAEIPGVPGLDS